MKSTKALSRFIQTYKELERGDIIFMYGISWISKIIEKVTGGASHVAIFLGDHAILESTISYHINWWPFKMRVENGVQIGLWDKSRVAENSRIRIAEVEGITSQQIEKTIDWGKTKIGKKYSILQLFIDFALIRLGIIKDTDPIMKVFDVKNTYVCSEYVAKCFNNGAHIRLTPIALGLTRPSDLELSAKLIFRK